MATDYIYIYIYIYSTPTQSVGVGVWAPALSHRHCVLAAAPPHAACAFASASLSTGDWRNAPTPVAMTWSGCFKPSPRNGEGAHLSGPLLEP